MHDRPVIRVVVIDDSAYNRQTLVAMLESDPAIRVVARAADGDEGLRQVLETEPDVVTLDLEMPRMDGFTFLRILMARRPTPVLVVSGWGARENVFKALELGALDFLVKPARQISPELRTIRDELVAKVKMVTQLRMLPSQVAGRLPPLPTAPLRIIEREGEGEGEGEGDADPGADPTRARPVLPPQGLVAIGASTGGPPALQTLIASLDPRLPIAVAITQHMPPRFTRAFAERLQRSARFAVKEAEDGDLLGAGQAVVAPGWGSLLLRREGGLLRVSIEQPDASARYVPSVDRMLETAAEAMGADVLGIVLTGMGGDGGRGVRTVKARRGRVIAESAETAVIFGMPQEAIATGAVDEVLPLGKIPDAIERFARRGEGTS